MNTLYLECNMGAAGDMLMGALLELHPKPEDFLKKMNSLPFQGVSLSAHKTEKQGILGSPMHVTIKGRGEKVYDKRQEHSVEEHSHGHVHCHTHATLHEIVEFINALPLPKKVVEDAKNVYNLLAKGESYVHGKPVAQIHFHEVGMMDAIVDIVGVCLLIYELAPAKIMASPICTGYGKVRCAHGILPVPAPATAYLLRDIPCYGGDVEGELCTPTGAALLKYFVQDFSTMPLMKMEKIGYGMGTKDFEEMNCIRAILGETHFKTGQVAQLCCNLDDMSPEALAFAQEELFQNGALDVFITPVQMKKNRSGVLLTCLCSLDKREEMVKLLFRHTSTLGVRETIWDRYMLERETKLANTPYGPIHVKKAWGWGVQKVKGEFEDVAKAAREHHVTIDQVLEALE